MSEQKVDMDYLWKHFDEIDPEDFKEALKSIPVEDVKKSIQNVGELVQNGEIPPFFGECIIGSIKDVYKSATGIHIV